MISNWALNVERKLKKNHVYEYVLNEWVIVKENALSGSIKLKEEIFPKTIYLFFLFLLVAPNLTYS